MYRPSEVRVITTWARMYSKIISQTGLGMPSRLPLPSQTKDAAWTRTASGVPSVVPPAIQLS